MYHLCHFFFIYIFTFIFLLYLYYFPIEQSSYPKAISKSHSMNLMDHQYVIPTKITRKLH